MKLVIDGRDVVCRSGATILEAARGAGLTIPSLCDHQDLEPFAGCRICLVEVEGRRDYAPACATPAEDGQVVRTRTPEIMALRRKILEFILAQHPYACLVCPEKATCDDLKSTIRKTGEVTGCVLCPENGACELQKVAAEVGLERVDLPAVYRNREVRKEDPFFDRDYNLCILCGRCIRVCEEIRGAAVLSFINRGGRTEVGTALDRPLLDSGCQFCGACVDVCPTGALVERAARPQRRPESAAAVVCPFCGQGCVLGLGLREGQVLESTPLRAAPNRGQACVRGRFLVRPVLSGPGRILEPHVRKEGRLEPAGLEEALDRAAAGLGAAKEERRALVYPTQVPLEDAYLFLEFGRRVLRAGSLAASPAPALEAALGEFAARHSLGFPAKRELAGIGESRAILAWDVDLPRDHPIAWLEVVRAARRGAGLVLAGGSPAGPVVGPAAKLELGAGGPATAAGLAAALIDSLGGGLPALDGLDLVRKAIPAAGAVPERARRPYKDAARVLTAGRPAVILFDAAAAAGPSGQETLAWLWNIAQLVGGRLMPLARGANERGVHELVRSIAPGAEAGFEALRPGLEARAYEALYLGAPVPDLGDLRPPFVVCQDTHWSPNAERADVVLPAAAFAEAGGTWVNTEGRVRTFAPARPCPGAARPDGAILAALAGRLGHPAFAARPADAVLEEISGRVPRLKGWGEAGSDGLGFLDEESGGQAARFAAVAAPPPRRPGRPSRKAKATAGAGPGPESLRGFDLHAGSRGYAKLRRAR